MAATIHWVVTVVGQDRPGLVDALSDWVVGVGGDWQDSHLTHIGDQFAGILEVYLPVDSRDTFLAEVPVVEQQTGLSLTLREAGQVVEEGQVFDLACVGQDRPGIVKALTDILLEVRANVETLETSSHPAPMSGEQLFEANFRVRLPEGVDPGDVEGRLSRIGDELMLDVQLDR